MYNLSSAYPSDKRAYCDHYSHLEIIAHKIQFLQAFFAFLLVILKFAPFLQDFPRKKARLTLNILCTILRGAGRLTRAIIGSLRITKIDVVLGVRGEDPAEAALSYGSLNAWLYPALGFLDRFVYLDFEQLRLLPDFGSAQPTVQDRVSFRVSAQAYAIVFTAVRVLYEFWREKVLDVFL